MRSTAFFTGARDTLNDDFTQSLVLRELTAGIAGLCDGQVHVMPCDD